MKKSAVGAVLAGMLLVGAIGAGSSQSPQRDTIQKSDTAGEVRDAPSKAAPVCDGKAVTTGCDLGGISYKTYIYHPAVAEKTHPETVNTYREEVTGYCTLCADGSYSPTCATGRGACSHHGGVAQWNAPVTNNVPVATTKTVVDAPAQDAYYEKVTQ